MTSTKYQIISNHQNDNDRNRRFGVYLFRSLFFFDIEIYPDIFIQKDIMKVPDSDIIEY